MAKSCQKPGNKGSLDFLKSYSFTNNLNDYQEAFEKPDLSWNDLTNLFANIYFREFN